MVVKGRWSGVGWVMFGKGMRTPAWRRPMSNDGSKQSYWICAPESFTTLLQRLISASIWVRSAAGVEPTGS